MNISIRPWNILEGEMLCMQKSGNNAAKDMKNVGEVYILCLLRKIESLLGKKFRFPRGTTPGE